MFIQAITRTRLLPATLLLALTAGCAFTEPVVRPELELPAQWAEGASTVAAPIHDTWWQDFGSARLDALIDEALRSAPDLRIQGERVVQAELALRQGSPERAVALVERRVRLGGGTAEAWATAARSLSRAGQPRAEPCASQRSTTTSSASRPTGRTR